jgi:hypothetical protein
MNKRAAHIDERCTDNTQKQQDKRRESTSARKWQDRFACDNASPYLVPLPLLSLHRHHITHVHRERDTFGST